MARLLSVNVGLPREVTWQGKTVRTSVWKSPVTGRRMVRKLDIDGDAQRLRARRGFRNGGLVAGKRIPEARLRVHMPHVDGSGAAAGPLDR